LNSEISLSEKNINKFKFEYESIRNVRFCGEVTNKTHNNAIILNKGRREIEENFKLDLKYNQILL
jgi:hypothetical protein